MIKHTLPRLSSTDSPYRGALSEAVLLMQESGEITSMKIKWWKEKRGGGACTVGPHFWSFFSVLWLCLVVQDTAEEGGAEELTVANVGGVFAVLISGAAVGIVVAIFEMLLDVRNRAMELEVLLSFSFFKSKKWTFYVRRFHSCKSSSLKWGSSRNAPETRRLSITRNLHGMRRWNMSRAQCRDPPNPSSENKRPLETMAFDPVWRTWTSSIWCRKTKLSTKFNWVKFEFASRCSFQCSHLERFLGQLCRDGLEFFFFLTFCLATKQNGSWEQIVFNKKFVCCAQNIGYPCVQRWF